MSITGNLTKTDDGAYTGFIASLTFDVPVTLLANTHKRQDSHPDYAVMGKSPKNRDIRIGSAWIATSQAGNEYLSIALDIGGSNVRVNAVQDTEANDAAEYSIIPWAS